MSGIKHKVEKLIKKGDQDKAASLASKTLIGNTISHKDAQKIQKIRFSDKKTALQTSKEL